MPSPFVLFVSGNRDSGKTSICLEIFKCLSKLGFSIGGVVTVKSGRTENFDKERFVVDLATNKRSLFAIRKPNGSYKFIPSGVRFANRIIREFSGDVLIVDEVGKLEKRGRGFQEIFRKLKTSPPKAVIISCRDINVGWLQEKLGVSVQKIEAKKPQDFKLAIKLLTKAVSCVD